MTYHKLRRSMIQSAYALHDASSTILIIDEFSISFGTEEQFATNTVFKANKKLNHINTVNDAVNYAADVMERKRTTEFNSYILRELEEVHTAIDTNGTCYWGDLCTVKSASVCCAVGYNIVYYKGIIVAVLSIRTHCIYDFIGFYAANEEITEEEEHEMRACLEEFANTQQYYTIYNYRPI